MNVALYSAVSGSSRLRRAVGLVLLVAALAARAPAPLHAFSVLTHETIIDALWDTDLVPALRARYPSISGDALREAHAYAYGGCLIQDMGYYPFGSRLFTDLAHYARTGTFVLALLRDARDADEYAFALGALAHYAADSVGHPDAINRAVPMLYPKLEQRYGRSVTYAEDPAAHLKTEFGFDVAQVANGHFAPKAYHDFIGFQVAKPLLERAFDETYGLPLKDLFASEDLAIGTYRRAVASVIPQMTKVAWKTKEKEISEATPGITREKFVLTVSRASYEREWGNQYERAGFFARFFAFVVRVLPKVGPLKALAFKPPTPEAERAFMDGFNRTVARFKTLLASVREDRLHLEDVNLDTGRAARAGDYPLADRSFAELLDRLSRNKFEAVSPDLRRSILAFYDGARLPSHAGIPDARWERTFAQLYFLEHQAR